MATIYETLAIALKADLDAIYPVADYPIENADYTILIAEYCAARQAQASLSARPHSSYSSLGVTFSFRDPGGASRTAATLAVRLARAGFAINAGTPVAHDIREVHEPVA